MSTLSAFEAKTRFGEVLDRVARGEEVVITRHDKPVARIVPEGRPALRDIRNAVKDLRALREEISASSGFDPLTDEETHQAIHEGRR